MTLYYDNKTAQVTPEEAKKKNQEQIDWRWKYTQKGYGSGCITGWYCEGCGRMIRDTLCLCIGRFTCPVCEHEQNKEYFDTIQTTNIVYDGENSFNLPMTFRLTKEMTNQVELDDIAKETRDW